MMLWKVLCSLWGQRVVWLNVCILTSQSSHPDVNIRDTKFLTNWLPRLSGCLTTSIDSTSDMMSAIKLYWFQYDRLLNVAPGKPSSTPKDIYLNVSLSFFRSDIWCLVWFSSQHSCKLKDTFVVNIIKRNKCILKWKSKLRNYMYVLSCYLIW